MPILKKRKENNSKSKKRARVAAYLSNIVHFAHPDKLEEIIILENDDSQISDHDHGHDDSLSDMRSSSICLCDLALHGTTEEMIAHLKSGASARGSESKKPLDAIKNSIATLDHQRRASKSADRHAILKQSIHDLNQKQKVLKIFKSAEIAIDLARFFSGTRIFQIQFFDLNDVELTDVARDANVSDSMFCVVSLDS